MRVLVCGSFADHEVLLSQALMTEGLEVMVVLSTWGVPDRFRNLVESGLPIYSIANERSCGYASSIRCMLRTLRQVAKFDPELVHMEAWGGLPDLVTFIALARRPLVVTFHDVRLHVGEEFRFRNLTRSMIRRTANRIIVHGNRLKDQMAESHGVPRDRIDVVPLGAPELYAFRLYDEGDASEVEGRVLFFGRIHEYKGLEYLIKAEPLITERVPGAKIVVAGRGADFGRYREMIGDRIENFIIYNRRVSWSEGARLFRQSSIVVLPYIEGSQSGVAPIAYGYRKPVVATNVGSIPEMVVDGYSGLIVPPRDSSSLATAIVSLLENEGLRNQMGENGHSLLSSQLSWGNVAKGTVEIYRRTLADRWAGLVRGP